MSFFSDLFHGNFGNLGNDLNPSNAFSDFGSSAGNFFSNPINDIALAGAVALPFLAPEILPALSVGGAAADLGTLGGVGAEGLGAGLDTSALGGTVDIGLPTVTGAADAAGGLSDEAVASLQASPGASAFATTQAPSAFDTAITMGGGGDLSPAAAATAGAPVPGSVGGAAVGDATVTPLTSFEGAIPSPANPSVGGTFGFPGAAPVSPTGGTDILSQLGNFMGSPAGKGLSTAAGVAGLGYNLYQGRQQQKAMDALNQQEQQQAQVANNIRQQALAAAQPMLASGTVLSSYIANNTLPPEFQSQLDQIIAAQKAQIRQGYASRSVNDPGAADPNKNSALAQDLASVDQQAQGLKAQIESQLASAGNNMVTTANQLLAQGLNATQIGSAIPIQMAKLNQELNQQIMLSISNFSAALNGRGNFGNNQGITINTTTGQIQ